MMFMTAVCIYNYHHDWSERFMRLLKVQKVIMSIAVGCHGACFVSKLKRKPIL